MTKLTKAQQVFEKIAGAQAEMYKMMKAHALKYLNARTTKDLKELEKYVTSGKSERDGMALINLAGKNPKLQRYYDNAFHDALKNKSKVDYNLFGQIAKRLDK